MTEEDLKEKYCSKCSNIDGKRNCIVKYEEPFDIVCENGEMFEPDYSDEVGKVELEN